MTIDQTRKILRIGHRGAMGHALENTLASFQKAIDCGVHMIELDCLTCQTGEAVVFHDYKLTRLAGNKAYVRKKSLTQLKEFKLKNGETIPTLSEALDFIDRRATINIDLKGNLSLKPVLKTIEHYVKEKGWSYSDFLLSTFDRGKLKKIKRAHAEIPVGVLASYSTVGLVSFAKSIKARAIHPHKKLLKVKLLTQAHSAGLNVYVWTVNEPKEIEQMKALGVDGIFSDYPDRI